MKLAEKLIYLRKEKRLSQLKLAELMNVSRQAVSRWEVGAATPSIENLRYLSGLYGVSMEYLLDEDEDSPTAPAETGGGALGKKAVLKLAIAAVCVFALGAGAAFGLMGLAGRDDTDGEIGQRVYDGYTIVVGGTDSPSYTEMEPDGEIGGRLYGYGTVEYDGQGYAVIEQSNGDIVGMISHPALEN